MRARVCTHFSGEKNEARLVGGWTICPFAAVPHISLSLSLFNFFLLSPFFIFFFSRERFFVFIEETILWSFHRKKDISKQV